MSGKSEHRAEQAAKEPVDGIVIERRHVFAIPATLWVVGSFFIVSLVVGLALGIPPILAAYKSVDQNVATTIIAAVIYVLLLALVLGGPRVLKLWSGRFDYRRLLGLRRLMEWRDILYAIVGFAVYLALGVGLILLIAAVVPDFNASQAQDTGFSKILAPSNAILVFLSLVVIAPIAEEIIFRGYLFGTLRRSLPVWAAAVLTSLVFGLIHLQWNVGVDVFVMSLVSCFLRYKTGSLWASILLHMAKNGLAFYTLYIATSAIMK